ncbi:MAG: NAD(P)-binding protein, partial [Alphaproteobacteria bacterium]|nr:NAD(P)-binding protein [Alphaproteobacteria bacterium]
MAATRCRRGARKAVRKPRQKGEISVPKTDKPPVSRRSLLKFIGATGGGALMYDTMVAMGYTGASDFNGPIKLSNAPKGASVLILGAGLAGMTAAYEMRKAGYKVQLLEYNARPGGRNWSLYGG